MNQLGKRILLLSLAAFAVVTAMLAIHSYRTRAAAPRVSETKRSNGGDMFESLDKAAKRARAAEKVKKAHLSPNVEEANREYEDSIRELADVLFKEFGSEIPPGISERIKERLIRAELKYRESHQGVREGNVVEVINNLASRFGAPDYAKTTLLQVRFMRASLRRYVPNLVAVETQESRMGLRQPVGTGMNPEVSPLEAAFLALLMVQQKMLNDDWQQTPEEWAANQKKRYLSRPKVAPQDNAGPQFGVSPEDEERQRRNNEKRNEMRLLVYRGAAKLNPARLNDLIQSSLDTLGIAKSEEVK